MPLSAADLAAISRLLDEGLALDAPARGRWLDAMPAEHQHLVAALRRMLAPDRLNAESMLDRPPHLPEHPEPEPAALSSFEPGQDVGPYQLMRELGAGGMAEVWLARRADGAYKRDLALKLPKLARLHKDLQRRFAHERDILASLEHPNIARLYDAGVSPDGLPYLAMEYVQGQPLTAWCDAHRVGLRERLKLFLQVIDAVQFAHSFGIVHRDLKPSNILVAASGQVRLLDFGVAKLLAEEEADGAPVHLYSRALTPDYASPELLRGETVDAASDVYSLGAVLYELLSGDRPYRLGTARSAAFFDRAIANARIEKPSARVAPGAGIARATTQERLAGRLRGDLDAITLKALAASPADRYASVAALAQDVHRYLTGKPVEALPDRLTTEQLVKQLSRNPNVRVKGSDERAGGRETVAAISSRAATNGSASSGRTLRITAQMLRTLEGRALWSRTYDINLDDAGQIDASIAETIADALRAAQDSNRNSAEEPRANAGAYNLFLQADFFRRRSTRNDLQRAVELFSAALELEPGFASAWALLAAAYVEQALQKWVPVAEAINRAQTAVTRALVLDGGLAAAHATMGVLYARFYWNWTRAHSELRRACELDPVDDRARAQLAFFGDAVFGRLDPAIAALRHVIARNPLDTPALSALAWLQLAADRPHESVTASRQLLSFNSQHGGGHACLALALVQAGQPAHALDAAQREADEVARLAVLPIVFWATDERAKSDLLLRKLEDECASTGAYQIAQNYAFRNDVDAAFEWLDRAYRERDPGLPWLKVDPLLRNLARDERYQAMLGKMKLNAPRA
jgi:serine/threonine protein kinase